MALQEERHVYLRLWARIQSKELLALAIGEYKHSGLFPLGRKLCRITDLNLQCHRNLIASSSRTPTVYSVPGTIFWAHGKSDSW